MMADQWLDSNVMKTKAESTQSSQAQVEMPGNLPQETVPTGLTVTPAPSSQELTKKNLTPPEKFKASNFPALSLQIGPWKIGTPRSYIIAKFYYQKQRIVWEITLNGTKKKMEIKWHRVSAISASFADGRPDTLEIELEKPPKFYFESNLPRGRITKWIRGDDFTSSYAEIYKRHSVEFTEGTLENHFVKLLHADRRLNELSQRPFPTVDSSIFFDSVPIEKRLQLTELALHRPSASVSAMQQHLAQQLRSQVRTAEVPPQITGMNAISHQVNVADPYAAFEDRIRYASPPLGVNPFSKLSGFAGDTQSVLGAGSVLSPYMNDSGQEYSFFDPILLAGPRLDNAGEVQVPKPLPSIVVRKNEGSEAEVPMLLPSIAVPKKRRYN